MTAHKCREGETPRHKQLWAQRAVKFYGVELQKVPHAENAAYILTHSVEESGLGEGFQRVGYYDVTEWLEYP